MLLKKIPSSFDRLSGNEKLEGVEYKKEFWAIGRDNNKVEAVANLDDLLEKYPLMVKFLRKEYKVKKEKIAISIPSLTYSENAKLKEHGKANLIDSLSKDIKNANPGIKEVKVLPQGVSALNHVYKIKALRPATTLIVDGGFNTINISIIEDGGKIVYNKTYYNELGIRNLLEDYFLPAVRAKHSEISTNLQKLKKIFLDGKINLLEDIDVSEEKKEALQSFISKLFARIIGDINKSGVSFDQFTILGGLSYYVPEKVIETQKKIFIPKENGEFLTVLGMKALAGKDFFCIDFGFGDAKFTE